MLACCFACITTKFKNLFIISSSENLFFSISSVDKILLSTKYFLTFFICRSFNLSKSKPFSFNICLTSPVIPALKKSLTIFVSLFAVSICCLTARLELSKRVSYIIGIVSAKLSPMTLFLYIRILFLEFINTSLTTS